MRYGSIPAAGAGARLQPLAYSKELALVDNKAVIEHLLERMILSGIDKIFITIDPDKLDIPKYLSVKTKYKDNLVFIVKHENHSLTDDLLAPVKFLKNCDQLFFGLPDTVWFPENGFKIIGKQKGDVVLGLFYSEHPEKFGSVTTDKNNNIVIIEDKKVNPKSNWVWGIGKIKVSCAKQILESLPQSVDPNKRLISDAINAYKKQSSVFGIKLKNGCYLDIGTKDDYKKAEMFIEKKEPI